MLNYGHTELLPCLRPSQQLIPPHAGKVAFSLVLKSQNPPCLLNLALSTEQQQSDNVPGHPTPTSLACAALPAAIPCSLVPDILIQPFLNDVCKDFHWRSRMPAAVSTVLPARGCAPLIPDRSSRWNSCCLICSLRCSGRERVQGTSLLGIKPPL